MPARPRGRDAGQAAGAGCRPGRGSFSAAPWPLRCLTVATLAPRPRPLRNMRPSGISAREQERGEGNIAPPRGPRWLIPRDAARRLGRAAAPAGCPAPAPPLPLAPVRASPARPPRKYPPEQAGKRSFPLSCVITPLIRGVMTHNNSRPLEGQAICREFPGLPLPGRQGRASCDEPGRGAPGPGRQRCLPPQPPGAGPRTRLHPGTTAHNDITAHTPRTISQRGLLWGAMCHRPLSRDSRATRQGPAGRERPLIRIEGRWRGGNGR
jgi:hypothetical protein